MVTMAMTMTHGNENEEVGDGNLWAFLADECPILVVPHSPARHNSTKADCHHFTFGKFDE